MGSCVIDASIWVDRAGQKPIVIGAGGERLKRVGRAVRLQLNEMLGRRVHLQLWVKVREDWADDARSLQQLGARMMRNSRRVALAQRLYPAPPTVPRYRPDTRGADAR